MPNARRVNYRAIHTKTAWRKASHDSIANALGNKRGAKALFSGRAAIDYKKHGKPLYVIIWEDGAREGLVVKADPNREGEILKVHIPIGAILRYEASNAASPRELEKYFESVEPLVSAETIDDPKPVVDAHVLNSILTRRGQKEFRENLFRAYRGRCAVTGCNAASVLEAAHIVPHAQGQSYAVTNGILLRADIHTLFDLFLLSVDPSTGKVRLAPDLRSCYPSLDGVDLQVPDAPNEIPDVGALKEHYINWQSNTKCQ